MIDYGRADAPGRDAAATFARARQQPRELRVSAGRGSREVRLLHDDVTEFFDATALEVADELEVADGRFSIAIVVAGDGWAEGEFGREPLRRGQTFAWPASLDLRVRAGREPVEIVRCMGPKEAS
jgi:mannose-6-phosphate isomerase class I